MEYIEFKLNEGYLDFKRATSDRLNILGLFLADEVGGGVSLFRSWAKDDIDQYTAGNATQLERKNSIIILSDQFSEEADGGPFLEIPKQEFIKLLDEWGRVCKEKPKEVIIIKEGDTYRVETKN